ncbi:sensor histidine kinase [Paraliobacillus sediminis]|uniref:ATP-binding protein n=1 Tax=Paraliobacillus sediminis TaxID=1885916 RepID=UPI0013C37485|nr:sensor histidine kinase [Paraliobacillus sediminis]
MILHYEELLINFLFIFIPYFLFQTLWLDKGKANHKNTNVIIVVLIILSITSCMAYPIRFSGGIIFDLRQIPFILGLVYFGWRVGLVLYLTIVVNQFLIGGEGVFISLIVTTFMLIFISLCKTKFDNLGLKGKMISLTLTAFFASLAIVLLSHATIQTSSTEQNLTSLNFVIIQGLSMLVITYIIKNSIENIRIREELLETEKLKVISELAASVSHEVRNPITVTKGFLQLLMTPEISDHSRQSYAALSLKELERAENIINDYLSITKARPNSCIISTMESDIEYVVSVLSPYAAIHNVDIITKCNNQLLVKYKQNKLQQSFINIAKNCIEAMPDGGILSIETIANKNNAIICIKDSGYGMTKQQLAKLGTAYFTTKKTGTGLGMTVSYNAIHAMNGTIKVDSTIGSGTEFKITLPGA